jgi:hypothetical protein
MPPAWVDTKISVKYNKGERSKAKDGGEAGKPGISDCVIDLFDRRAIGWAMSADTFSGELAKFKVE